jgi:mannose-6-phosphate isomerase-like protein (cupin superfamily)
MGGPTLIKLAETLQTTIVENRFGGHGEIKVKPLLTADEFCGKGRLFAHNVIPPGSSIGFHKHAGDFETYYILKGSGVVDDNGVKTAVKAGDLLYTPAGESHSIENTGTQDLELIALILFA